MHPQKPDAPEPAHRFANPQEIATFMARGTGRKPQKSRDELGRVTGWRMAMARPRPVTPPAQGPKVIAPRPRPRGAGRPAAARRTSSSSESAGADPGSDGEPHLAADGSSRSAVVA